MRCLLQRGKVKQGLRKTPNLAEGSTSKLGSLTHRLLNIIQNTEQSFPKLRQEVDNAVDAATAQEVAGRHAARLAHAPLHAGQVVQQVLDDGHLVLVDRLLGVLDQRAPDAAHRQLDLGVRVELIAIELGYDLMQVRRQLLARLSRNCTEAERRTLNSGTHNMPVTRPVTSTTTVVELLSPNYNVLYKYGTFFEFHMA